jgi:hypothetical protein
VCDGFQMIIDCPSVSLIFSHSGGSRVGPVTKASGPAAG